MKRFVLVILLLGGGMLWAVHPLQSASVAERDESFVTQFQLAKSRYLEARGEYLRARNDFIQGRAMFFSNRSSGEATLDQAKVALLNGDKAAIQYLELLRTVVQASSALEESDRSLFVGELSSDITWLTQKQKEIEVASSRKELIGLGVVIREYWNDKRPTVKRVAGQMVASDVDRISERFKTSRDLISKKIDTAKSEGRETTRLEQFFQNYSSQLESVEASVNRAKLQFQSIQSLEDGDAAFQSGHELLKEATQALRTAHQTLLSLLAELEGSGGVENTNNTP